eukprot:CAMPEP_0174842772 /NCGR_PEP_ID=MMETSP1114-20130205/10112_1 /TAXON_ID=312471 /ORGANISM="Neobodo designis, Strain CCAP 1951/1" /LENGTH=693 /DNA_ID=CAMNT_0016076981 /DNA_START=44 /DNA_END=2125 /DNA_ORIENTATION=+
MPHAAFASSVVGSHSPPPLVRFGSRRASNATAAEVDPTASIRAAANEGAAHFSKAELRLLRTLYSRRLHELGTVAGVEHLLDDVSLLCAPALLERALEHVGVPVCQSDRSQLTRVLTWQELIRLVVVLGTPPREAASAEEADRLQLIEVLQALECEAAEARAAAQQAAQEGLTSPRTGQTDNFMRSEPIVLPRVGAGGGASLDVDERTGVSLDVISRALATFDLQADLESATGVTPRPASAGPKGAPPKLPILSLARALADGTETGEYDDLISLSSDADDDGASGGGGHSASSRGHRRGGRHRRQHHLGGDRGPSGRSGTDDPRHRVVIQESQRGEGTRMIDEYLAAKHAAERARAARRNIDNLVHGESIHRRGTMARLGTSTLLSASNAEHARSMRRGSMMGASTASKSFFHLARKHTAMSTRSGDGGAPGESARGTFGRRRSHALSMSEHHSEADDDVLTSADVMTSAVIESEPFPQFPFVVSEPRRQVNPLAWGKKPRSPRPWQTSKAKTPDPRPKSRRTQSREAQRKSKKPLHKFGITDEELNEELRRRGLQQDANGKFVPLSTRTEEPPAEPAPERRESLAPPPVTTGPETEDPRLRAFSVVSNNSITSNSRSRSNRSPRSPSAMLSPLAHSTREMLRNQKASCSATFSPEMHAKCADEAAKLFADGSSPERRKQIGRWLFTTRVPGK